MRSTILAAKPLQTQPCPAITLVTLPLSRALLEVIAESMNEYPAFSAPNAYKLDTFEVTSWQFLEYGSSP